MAESAKNLIYQHYSKEIPIEIEVIKEPDNMTIGTANDIM